MGRDSAAALDAAMIMWTALSSKELEHGGNK